MADPDPLDVLAAQHGAQPTTTTGAQNSLDALAAHHGALASTSSGSGPATVAQPEKSTVDSLTDFTKEALASLNPAAINRGVQSAFWHPLETIKALGSGPAKLAQAAEESFKKGDYVTGSRHLLNSVIPLLGQRVDEAGNLMQKGEIAKGLGATADVGLQVAGPLAAKASTARAGFSGVGTIAPEEQAAIAFAKQRGIPVDATTATGGNAAMTSAQAIADRSIGGSIIAQRAKNAQAAALGRTGQEIAGQVNAPTTGMAGTAQTAEQAGEGVRTAMQAKVDALRAQANTAYDRFRAIETDPKNAAITSGAMRVDIRPTKAALTPVLEDLQKTMPLGLQQMSRPLKALENILAAPDYLDASVAESNLGSLKALQRMSDTSPNAQRIIGQVIDELDKSVMGRVEAAGPEAKSALLQGRAATRQKYETAGVLESLAAEPVGIFNRATWANDKGIAALRTVAKEAPDQMRNVGRAWLDDALQQMQQPHPGGGISHGERVAGNWQKLGPETRAILFGDEHAASLDKFFTLAKNQAYNVNPSGSGHLVVFAGGGAVLLHPATGIPIQLGLAGMSKLLHSEAGVKLLTQGLTMPVKSAAAPAVAAELAKLTGDQTDSP